MNATFGTTSTLIIMLDMPPSSASPSVSFSPPCRPRRCNHYIQPPTLCHRLDFIFFFLELYTQTHPHTERETQTQTPTPTHPHTHSLTLTHDVCCPHDCLCFSATFLASMFLHPILRWGWFVSYSFCCSLLLLCAASLDFRSPSLSLQGLRWTFTPLHPLQELHWPLGTQQQKKQHKRNSGSIGGSSSILPVPACPAALSPLPDVPFVRACVFDCQECHGQLCDDGSCGSFNRHLWQQSRMPIHHQ